MKIEEASKPIIVTLENKPLSKKGNEKMITEK